MPVRSQSFHLGASARLAAGALLWLGIVAGGLHRARAHDYWLEPGSPWAARGDELVMHLWLGEKLKGEEERPLQKERITYFDLFGDRSGRRDLLAAGREGQVPVAKVRMENASALTIMDRPPRPVTMDGDKYTKYLTEEGADAVLALRAHEGQTGQPGREVYSRCLKALIQERDPAAATPNTLYKRRVGQRLEILLENDPSRLKPDGRLTVKVLFEGRPLAGAKVFACRRVGTPGENQPPAVLTAKTDAAGITHFKLDQPGLWLVRLVHIRPATVADRRGDSGAQWESVWAAYTFGARLAPVAVPAPGSGPSPAASPAASPKDRRAPAAGGE